MSGPGQVFDARRNVRLLGWFNFFSDFRLYAPVAVLYFAQVGGSYLLATTVFSAVMVSAAVFEVPTGLLSDRLGRRRTLILGASASLTAVTLYAVGGSYPVLLAGAVFEGLARSLYSGNNDALLYDSLSSPGEGGEFAGTLGRVSAMFQLALGLSALLGSTLASVSYGWVLWPSAVAQALCLGLAFGIKEPARRSPLSGNQFSHLRDAAAAFAASWKLRWVGTATVLAFGVGQASYEFRAAFVATLWPPWAIGAARTLSSFAAALSFRLSGNLLKRMSGLGWIMSGLVYGHGVELVSLLFPSPISPALMSTGSLFYGVSMVSRTTLMQREFTDAQRATMASLHAFAGSLFFAAAAAALGLLADQVGPRWALVVSSLFGLTIALLYLPLLRRQRASAP